MKDLLTLTPAEANKIECLLLTLTSDIERHIDICEELANSETMLPAFRETMKGNAEWFRECYKLLYGKEYTKPLTSL